MSVTQRNNKRAEEVVPKSQNVRKKIILHEITNQKQSIVPEATNIEETSPEELIDNSNIHHWFIESMKMQNILNNQLYGMSLGLMNQNIV